MAYEIDDISVVEPEKLQDISIDPDEDICTLVTCTPYGVNSHRLVLRGHRIPYDADDDNQGAGGESYYRIRVPDILGAPDLSEILAILGAAVLITGLIVIIVKKIKRKKSDKEGGNKNEKDS